MINKVILVGNVGRDPEVRYLDSGVAVAKFPLATSETYTNKNGERVTNTEWHNIVIWRKLAEIVEKYVHKGQQLYLEGKISNRSYEDKEGIKRYITEVVVDNMQMLGKKSDGDKDSSVKDGIDTISNDKEISENTSQIASKTSGTKDLSPSNDEDDLPF